MIAYKYFALCVQIGHRCGSCEKFRQNGDWEDHEKQKDTYHQKYVLFCETTKQKKRCVFKDLPPSPDDSSENIETFGLEFVNKVILVPANLFRGFENFCKIQMDTQVETRSNFFWVVPLLTQFSMA